MVKGSNAFLSETQSVTVLSNTGMEFSPVDRNALFLVEIQVINIKLCFQKCHETMYCRIFNFDSETYRCQLFEGDVDTMGSIIPSFSTESIVGSIKLNVDQFKKYASSCSSSDNHRYLVCVNNTYECPLRTYYDGVLCRSKKLFGQECQNENECRSDMNYTCLVRKQCGPSSLNMGITVAGSGSLSNGSNYIEIRTPIDVVVDTGNMMYVSDAINHQVVTFPSDSPVGTIIAGTGVAGNRAWELKSPKGLYLDSKLNLYIADSENYRVMLWMKNASVGIQVAGTGIEGSSFENFKNLRSISVDSVGNIFACDISNHRVMKWSVNTTSGIIVAGNGTPGSANGQLDQPYDLLLDESTASLYILDTGNHRIQRCNWDGSGNCTTSFGVNGFGTSLMQMNSPYNFFRSDKTGTFYISDTNNHRVLKWRPGMRDAILIAGVTGLPGNVGNLLNGPRGITTNVNETHMYVADFGNKRIQRYILI